MRIHELQLAQRVFRAIVSKYTVLIMTRTFSDSKFLKINKITASLAIVGLVGAGLVVGDFEEANALDANLRIDSISSKSFVRHFNSVRDQATHKVKKHFVKKSVVKAFKNIGHRDQSRFVLINFDAPIAQASNDNLVTLPLGYSEANISTNAFNPKIIHIDKDTPRHKLKSKNTQKGSGLKLIAGGLKTRAKQSRGITGLQEVMIPKGGLQYVAGNGQNKLGSYIAKNCSNVLVCVLPDFGASKQQATKGFAIATRDTKKLTRLPKAKTAMQTIADTPKVILLDESFQ